MKDIIALAIAWGAYIACYVLVYQVLITMFWAWFAWVVAVCSGMAMLGITQTYTRDHTIPGVLSFARGTVQLCSASIDWVRDAARRDHVVRGHRA